MAEDKVTRKLTSILAADVEGYTRLMRADEEATLKTLDEYREIIDGLIARHDGRVFSTGGDSVLAEFGSAVEAVRCAISCQEEISSRNAELADDRKLMFRIGINVGDVMVRDGDLFGDGVNVAARLEGLAEAGGVCISGSVFEQIKHKLSLGFEDMGQQEVKNIAEPVSAYRLVPGQASAAATTATKPSDGKRWRMPAIAVVVAVLFAIVGGALWWQPWAPDVEPASLEKMVLPLPDKPSIAVLPFDNMSGDSEQAYFADGMTDDLTTGLSKLSGLFVISRSSTFTYKGKPVKVRQVAEELGVRYVLEGSVRRVGDQVRINAQLIDALSGYHVWAEKYDGSLADVFALQDRVTANIINALAVTLTPEEREDVDSFGTTIIDAHDAFLQGQSFYFRDTPEDNAKAEAYFKRAVELDPEFARASTALAKVYLKGARPDWGDALQLNWRDAYRLASLNLERAAGKRISDVHVVRAWLAIPKHQLDVAVMEAERALELSPNEVDALEAMSEALIFTGKPDEGRKLAEQAMRLNPTLPARALYLVGLSHFAEGSFQEAATHIERALRYAPTVSEYAGVLAAAYGYLGLEEKAGRAYETFSKAWVTKRPSVEQAMFYLPVSDARILENLADGLEMAGVRTFSVLAGESSRYLQLHSGTKLDGKEVKSLLFGRTIKGNDYWTGGVWSQVRSEGGKVTHTGFPIIVWGGDQRHGTSWIEDDRLCDLWPDVSENFFLCALIYRNPGGTRARRNEYFMVTDFGPQPFSPTD